MLASDPTPGLRPLLEEVENEGNLQGLEEFGLLTTFDSFVSLGKQLLAEMAQWECDANIPQLYDNYQYRVINRLKGGMDEGEYQYAEIQPFYCCSYKCEGGWYRGYISGDGLRVFHGVFISDDGDRYEGQWKDDKPHGYGTKTTLFYTYQGFWLNGVKHGFGKGELGQSIYEGQWKADQYHGYGELQELGSGTQYKGGWKDGVKAGYGELWERDTGNRYKGSWWGDKKHGFGVETYPSGSTFEGFWAKDCPDGPGKLSYSSGFSFHGDWTSGKQSCRLNPFLYSYKDIPVFLLLAILLLAGICGLLVPRPVILGEVYQRYGDGWYSGELRDGVREGSGKYVGMNGDFYDGRWLRDEMEGTGVLSASNRTVFIGEFRGNRFVQGKVIDKSREEDLFVGEVQNSCRSGLGIHITPKNDYYYGNWTDSTLSGLLYSSNSNLYIGLFHDLKLKSGRVVHHRPSNALYIGGFLGSREDGAGLLLNLSSNADCYIGNWSKGSKSGFGVEIHSLDLSIGEFASGKLVNGTHVGKKAPLEFHYLTVSESKKDGFVVEKEANSLFIGLYSQGKKSGEGLLAYTSGQFLIGTFTDDKLAYGQGLVLTELNRYWYYGGIREGGFGGQGIQWDSAGFVYSGDWDKGQKHGHGFEISPDFSLRLGEFTNDSLTNGTLFLRKNDTWFLFGTGSDQGNFSGFGTIYSETSVKSVYLGKIANGVRAGAGVLLQGTSLVEKGIFAQSKLKTGFRFQKSQSGEMECGDVKNFLKDGPGLVLYANNTVVVGEWRGGERKGSGLQVAESGEHSCGWFEGGVLTAGRTLQSVSDGRLYYGEVQRGVFSGKGTLFHPNASLSTFSLYAGEWRNGTSHGRGVQIQPESKVKTGEFAEGSLFKGLAFLSTQDKSIYFGEVLKGQIEGAGSLVGNKEAYTGNWANGVRTGSGRRVTRGGEYQEGVFRDDVFSTGFALQLISEKSLYVGQVFEGNFSGKGTYITVSVPTSALSVYTGDWAGGAPYGKGLSCYLGKNVSWGEFRTQGLWEGKAMLRYPNKDLYYGEIAAGKKDGNGVYIWENGTIYSGGWANDTTHGQGTRITGAGSVYIGEFNESSLVNGTVLEMAAKQLLLSLLLMLWMVGG